MCINSYMQKYPLDIEWKTEFCEKSSVISFDFKMHIYNACIRS